MTHIIDSSPECCFARKELTHEISRISRILSFSRLSDAERSSFWFSPDAFLSSSINESIFSAHFKILTVICIPLWLIWRIAREISSWSNLWTHIENSNATLFFCERFEIAEPSKNVSNFCYSVEITVIQYELIEHYFEAYVLIFSYSQLNETIWINTRRRCDVCVT